MRILVVCAVLLSLSLGAVALRAAVPTVDPAPTPGEARILKLEARVALLEQELAAVKAQSAQVHRMLSQGVTYAGAGR